MGSNRRKKKYYWNIGKFYIISYFGGTNNIFDDRTWLSIVVKQWWLHSSISANLGISSIESVLG